MKKRKCDAQTKAIVMLQGLKRKPVAEICQKHQINQNLYYKWCDQFLAMDPIFVDKEKVADKLNSENKHLRKIIEDLTRELKKPKSGKNETGNGSHGRAESADSRPYQRGKSRAPFWGIPADVGLPEICR